MLGVNNNRLGLPLLEFLFVIVACLYYSNYIVQSVYTYPMVAGFTGYVVYCYYKVKEYRKHIIIFMLMLIIFSSLYLLLTDTSSIGASVSNRALKRLFSKYYQFLSMFFPLFMFYRVATRASKFQIYTFFAVIFVNLLLLAQTALAAARINADILHSMRDESVEASGLSIAAFYFVYSYTFIVLIGIICYRKASNRFIRYVSLLTALACVYFLYISQFALSIVTCFFSILYLYYKTTRNKTNRLLVVMGLIVVLFLIPVFLEGLIELMPDNILKDRLTEIYGTITGKSVTSAGDGQGRLQLYWMCIKAFFSSPIIGNRTLPEDGHATLFTVPADIGIYGVIFLYTFFKNAYKVVANVLGNKKLYYKPLMFQIILMGMTNPIHSSPSIYIMLFFVCPLIIMLFIRAIVR